MNNFDTNFWKERYKNQQTGWDLGTISPPLKDYFDQLEDKSLKILIPGAGNAHEAKYLHEQGFLNVYVVDLVKSVLDDFASKNPRFNKSHLICSDVFELEGTFDLIIEQTFFCAIDPSLRNQYADKMKQLLSKNGKLVGLLFNKEFEEGPPFGGNEAEYRMIFCARFLDVKMESCYNSVAPRDGSEIFFSCKME